MMRRYLDSALPVTQGNRTRRGTIAALTEPQAPSPSDTGSYLARSNSTNTNHRLRLERFSPSSSSLCVAMASSLSSAQIRLRPPPPPGPAHSTETDVGLEHLRLPPIEPLPPLTIPTPFLPSSETAPPAIPPRARQPLSVVSIPDDATDRKMLFSPRKHSSGSLPRLRPPSVYDPLSTGISIGQSDNSIRISAITPQRRRKSSAASASHSLESSSSPPSSPLPSPSSVAEAPLTSSSPISDSSSTASGSSTGYYFYTGNGSKKHHHRRNLAILKNSISENYTPLEVLPPRASVRRSYFNISMDSIQSIQRPLENVSGEEVRGSNGHFQRRATTDDSDTAKPPAEQEREAQSNMQPKQQVRHVKSSSIRLQSSLRHDLENGMTNVPIFPANAAPSTMASTRTFSRLGLALSRMSRSSPDLRSQYLNNTVFHSEEDIVPLPLMPMRPATSGSAASTSSSSTSSVAKPHTLKSYKSLPRLKNFAKKVGVVAGNAASGPGKMTRSVSPLHHFGMGPGLPSRDSTIALVPPLPEKFLQQSECDVDGVSAGSADHDTSVSSYTCPGVHTTENPVTPTSTMESVPSPLSNDAVVMGDSAEQSRASSPNATITPNDSQVFYTPRSTLLHSPQSASELSPVAVQAAKRTISGGSDLSPTTATSTPNAMTDPELKRQWKRIRLIRELIDTEIAYLSDLRVIEKYYRAPALRQPFITKGDVVEIFANLTGVLEFTHQFCISLRSAGASAMLHENQDEELDGGGILDEQESFVGDTFLQAIPQLEKVYKVYCHSHEASIQRLHQLTANNSTQMSRWLDACHQASLSRTKAWNLESLLIKPVQRLMKYPLLLKLLAECTPISHPDKNSLGKAAIDIQGVADRTNEEQRRKDFEAAPGPADTTELRKGVTKGLVRSTERLRQTVGISERHEVIDRSYDILVDRYRRRHMELRIVVESFNSTFQVSTSTIEKLCTLACSFDEWAKLPVAKISASSSGSLKVPYPDIESQWRSFRRAIMDIHDHDLSLFRSAFVSHVISPLEHVLDLFDRPLKAMAKRDRKVPDYRRYLGLRERGVTPDKTVVALAESYLALNGALVKEIPKFLNFVDEMVKAVLTNWVHIQARWYFNYAKRIRQYCTKNFVDVPNQKSISTEDLETSFLLQFTSLDGVLNSLGICNGDLRHFLEGLDIDGNMSLVKSTPTLGSASSPSLIPGAFGSNSGNTTPKLKSSELANSTSQSRVRSVSSASNASHSRLTPSSTQLLHHLASDSTMRSDNTSKKRSALTSPSTASLISATHKSRHGRNQH
ncbi:uncharacterized protein V1513DRAFT_486463 [Lipomyces chichibuensis]|uniref:uncharacterized protein n=1 Tax=Lipomyces chichibuensis TaxID=1546026 RepID=UPI0033436F0A